eukprot:Skav220961  [mRNA]  locus=scaffold1928:171411:176160:- [translate_table: standard]
MVVTVDAIQLEGKGSSFAGDILNLGSSNLDSVQEHQALVLLDAEVAQRTIACHPHVALQPVSGIFWISIRVQLPQCALVQRSFAGSVLKAVTVLSLHLLALMKLLSTGTGAALEDVGIRQALGQ